MVKVEVKEDKSWKRTLEIELPPEETQQQLEEVIGAIRKKVTIPGFRRGKAPRKEIQRRFKESIRSEFYQKALPWAYRKALERANLKPVTDPTFQEIEYDEGGPLKFKAVVEVMPAVEIGNLEGIEVVGEVYEVGSEEAEQELERLREAHATFVKVDRPAASGDYVVVDYQKLNPESGEPQGPRSAGQVVELGAESLLPEFAEALTGAAAGEVKTVEVSYPSDFRDKELAGKKVSYLLEVKEIREKRLPELDDRFARRVSNYATLEQLKARIADNLRAEEAARSRRRIEEKLVDELLARHPFEAPESLVELLTERFIDSVTEGRELPEEEKDRLKRQYRPQMARKVRRDLLLDLIADHLGVEVSERDVALEMRRLRESGELAPGANDPETAERIRDRLRTRRTLDLLLDGADVKIETRPKGQGQGGKA